MAININFKEIETNTPQNQADARQEFEMPEPSDGTIPVSRSLVVPDEIFPVRNEQELTIPETPSVIVPDPRLPVIQDLLPIRKEDQSFVEGEFRILPDPTKINEEDPKRARLSHFQIFDINISTNIPKHIETDSSKHDVLPEWAVQPTPIIATKQTEHPVPSQTSAAFVQEKSRKTNLLGTIGSLLSAPLDAIEWLTGSSEGEFSYDSNNHKETSLPPMQGNEEQQILFKRQIERLKRTIRALHQKYLTSKTEVERTTFDSLRVVIITALEEQEEKIMNTTNPTYLEAASIFQNQVLPPALNAIEEKLALPPGNAESWVNDVIEQQNLAQPEPVAIPSQSTSPQIEEQNPQSPELTPNGHQSL